MATNVIAIYGKTCSAKSDVARELSRMTGNKAKHPGEMITTRARMSGLTTGKGRGGRMASHRGRGHGEGGRGARRARRVVDHRERHARCRPRAEGRRVLGRAPFPRRRAGGALAQAQGGDGRALAPDRRERRTTRRRRRGVARAALRHGAGRCRARAHHRHQRQVPERVRGGDPGRVPERNRGRPLVRQGGDGQERKPRHPGPDPRAASSARTRRNARRSAATSPTRRAGRISTCTSPQWRTPASRASKPGRR